MELNMGSGFSELNWPIIALCVVAGQIIATLWFTVLFGDSWAKEYGASSRQQHSSEIPAYTYIIGLFTNIALTLGIYWLQVAMNTDSLSKGLCQGVFISLFFCLPCIAPGQAFLKRWKVLALTAGSQSVIIIVISMILSVWK
jgi:hypothetical protein